MSTNKSIAKSASIISVATFCSRILGFIRDVVIAKMFGVYVYAQAFVIAFRIPNLFRDFVGEGATNAALVPVFSEYAVKRDLEEFWELANVVLNLLLVIVTAITLLGIICSPLLIRLIAPGFTADAHKFATTVTLNRVIFPYILLISLAAYCTGLLNTLKHFSVPAFAPCVLNISIIVCALYFGEGIRGLASGVLIGGILQLGVQIPVLYKKGFRLKLFRRFRHPGAKIIGVLMAPRLLSTGIYQLNNFVDTIFGSLAVVVGEGGVAILYFSYRLIQFPLGIFSTALSQAMLPAFSTQALEESSEPLKKTLLFGLRATSFVLVPASVAFIVLGKQIVKALFMGGRFDGYCADATATALLCYSVGLCAYGGTKILQNCFFALKDTVTPTKIAALSLGLNILLNALLIFPFRIAGIALATSISGIISFFVLLSLLKKRLSPLALTPLWVSFLKILAASLCMGGVCFWAGGQGFFCGNSAIIRLVNLVFVMACGIAAYWFFCLIFRVSEMRQLQNWLFRRFS